MIAPTEEKGFDLIISPINFDDDWDRRAESETWIQLSEQDKMLGRRREFKLQRLAYRMFHAMQSLDKSIEIDPERRGGIPVLKGTRFTASQVMAQLASGDSVQDLEKDLDLDAEVLRTFLRGISIILDRPYSQ